MKSTFPCAEHGHLRPRGQSGRGEAATPYRPHGRADPAAVRPSVRRTCPGVALAKTDGGANGGSLWRERKALSRLLNMVISGHGASQGAARPPRPTGLGGSALGPQLAYF
jgi:hypothetical protein